MTITDSLCLLYTLTNTKYYRVGFEGRLVFESPEFKPRMSFTERERKGDRLIFKIVQEFLLKGFFVLTNYGHSEGVDLLVICRQDGKIVAVCECKNYAKFDRNGKAEFVATDKFHEEIDKLNSFDILPNIEKWYIVSYEQILTFEQRRVLEDNHIKLRAIGYEP